jgi:magnesium chelatase subunit D
VSAALAGRGTVGPDDAALAARLVLGPRATRIPAPDEPAAAGPADPPDEPATQGQVAQEAEGNAIGDSPSPGRQSDEVILAAAAAIPPGLLAKLRLDGGTLARSVATGRAGATVHGSGRGRPAGTRRGVPGNAARLNLVETLRAAAPWQRLRRRQSVESQEPFAGETGTRLKVHRDDWRVTRLKRRSESTAIFVVDASGSAALHRLGEAKGAVELLLADCYVRRDRVAVIAFRGATAELLLPPTRSLVRAKRSLAGLPGGGGTPLATAIDAATCLAEAVRRKGQTPAIVLLTDGRANVTRDGRGVRAEAEADALVAARRARATGTRIILIDTSPRPSTAAERLAAECGALYLALPQADATKLSRSVQKATAPVHDRGGAGFRPAG